MVSNLLVAMVDVRRDVAFLLTDDAANPLAAAATASTSASRFEGRGVPRNQALEIDLRRALTASIASVADVVDLPTLAERRSPDPALTIHAPAAGDAPEVLGSPALDTAGTVVGMRNGITRAARPLSWVVALDEIDWMPPIQNETEMDRLATLTTVLW